MSFETTVTVRYSDVDAFGHVNNAAYATLLEEARIDFLTDILGEDPRLSEQDGLALVVANLEIQYREPIGMVDAVEVGVEATEVGESSVGLSYAIRHAGTVRAEAETTLVAYDRETAQARPLPDRFRDALADFADS